MIQYWTLVGLVCSQIPAMGQGMCFKANVKQESSSTSSAAAKATPVPSSTSSTSLPNGFPGIQKGIGSWFQANKHSDATNGKSWCGYPYKDYSNGFAPDLLVMSQGTNAVWPHPKWAQYGQEYCGLEAKVTNPKTGKSKLMYIIDAFDHRWVKTPGSIDIMKDTFQDLIGFSTNNKNDVIYDVTWELTGNRNPQYRFQGPGDP